MDQSTKKGMNIPELIRCIMYAVIINIMGSLSYWYGTVLKEILKNNFGV
jgi:hypothetical protein